MHKTRFLEQSSRLVFLLGLAALTSGCGPSVPDTVQQQKANDAVREQKKARHQEISDDQLKPKQGKAAKKAIRGPAGR